MWLKELNYCDYLKNFFLFLTNILISELMEENMLPTLTWDTVLALSQDTGYVYQIKYFSVCVCMCVYMCMYVYIYIYIISVFVRT